MWIRQTPKTSNEHYEGQNTDAELIFIAPCMNFDELSNDIYGSHVKTRKHGLPEGDSANLREKFDKMVEKIKIRNRRTTDMNWRHTPSFRA